jgi:hypothetical protein
MDWCTFEAFSYLELYAFEATIVLVTMDATIPTAITAAELKAMILIRYSDMKTPCNFCM